MTLEEIQKKLESGIDQSHVIMEGDGCNCSAVVVSPTFEGLSPPFDGHFLVGCPPLRVLSVIDPRFPHHQGHFHRFAWFRRGFLRVWLCSFRRSERFPWPKVHCRRLPLPPYEHPVPFFSCCSGCICNIFLSCSRIVTLLLFEKKFLKDLI